METAMQDPVFADDFKEYLSRVISEQYPDGDVPPSDFPPETTLHHVCCDRPPHPKDADYEVTSKTHLTRLVAACNVHKHTQTCYKYGHKTCRFGFERPEVEISHIKDGVIYLQRKKGNGWVNNYNSIMLQILRCNTDMKFICNGMDSKALSFYITDYITKKALTTHNAFPLIIAAQQQIDEGIFPCLPNPDYTPAQQRNRDLVVKCLNKLTTHTERSGPEVATLLLGKDLQYKSHTFTKAFITTFVNELSPKPAEAESESSASSSEYLLVKTVL
jgi:hypothetical protein